jgi:pre-rRNA-processing protein IPI3
VQAVSCIATTQHYVLSGSDDANINVWSLAHLLEADVQSEPEPEAVLSNHRGAITDLVVGPSNNRETALCVSTSRDKTCILWNYRTGQALRTLLYPEIPICARLDPSARALFVISEGRALFLTELFGEKPLLGSQASEPASIVIQAKHPIGVADEDAGTPSCLAVSYDGTSILTGHTRGKLLQWSLTDDSHPVELANLNASVTNIVFTPLISDESKVEPVTITKPNQSLRQITFNAKLNGNGTAETRFNKMVNTKGFSRETIEEAMLSFANPLVLNRNHWG